MDTLVALSTAGYVAIAVAAVYFLRRARVAAPSETFSPFVSVVVAARNEEEALPECLEALLRQDYPSEQYEIIVVDDHSTDQTSAIAGGYPVRCIPAAEDGSTGKAGALHTGIGAARGQIIAVTDADCRPPQQWVRRLTDQLQDGRCGIVCGVTTVADGSLWADVQAMDWLLLLGIAAGFSDSGIPITAMGNNMCFRREAYDGVGGYPAMPFSVTEDYSLFRAIHRRGSFRAKLLLHAHLRNVTLPLPTWREVLRQRKRWLRGGLRADFAVYLAYAIVFLAHLGHAALLFEWPLTALALFTLKSAADALVIRTAAARLGVRPKWTAFAAFEAYLTTYIIVLPFALALSPRITWKNRRH